MNTKWLMTGSALLMGVVGVALTFAPQEVLTYLFKQPVTGSGVIILQILGALYFAFAMVNWMAKANLIGGIYARPIAMGNMTHFVVGAFALLKGYSASSEQVVLIAAIVYVVLGALFTKVLFTHPVKEKEN
ncbi:MAG TPA: hypothetical protein VGK59_12935 [Ohtaekwangia sp.]